jgi:hypothetical protein
MLITELIKLKQRFDEEEQIELEEQEKEKLDAERRVRGNVFGCFFL